VIIALVLVAIVILVTEFASNVASASSTMPVVAGLALATGADPLSAGDAGGNGRQLGVHASFRHRAQRNRLGDRPCRAAAPLEGGTDDESYGAALIVGIVWMVRTFLG
jgi:solute carrier family 13 (sodium-dependent dicarboxylate transporter), member 2/3/5